MYHIYPFNTIPENSTTSPKVCQFSYRVLNLKTIGSISYLERKNLTGLFHFILKMIFSPGAETDIGTIQRGKFCDFYTTANSFAVVLCYGSVVVVVNVVHL